MRRPRTIDSNGPEKSHRAPEQTWLRAPTAKLRSYAVKVRAWLFPSGTFQSSDDRWRVQVNEALPSSLRDPLFLCARAVSPRPAFGVCRLRAAAHHLVYI